MAGDAIRLASPVPQPRSGMASGLIRSAHDAPRVPVDSPLALFAPEGRLDAPIPAPLYLLEFVAGTMKREYEQTAGGSIAHEEDSHQRRVLTYPDGVRLEVHVQGSQVVGLPTQFDKDYFFGLLRLAAEGRVRSDGTFIDPSYRDILRATGRPEGAGKLRFEAVKRALSRFAGLVITTNADVDYTAAARAVRDQEAGPMAPEGRPRRRTVEAKHWVLEYQVISEDRGNGQQRDVIGGLRINPLWLDQIAAGITTWLDVDAHNALASEWAKRIYQVLAIRAARGWRAQLPHVVSLEQFLEELGVASDRERGKLAENVRKALGSLTEAGLVAESRITRTGRGQYEVCIYPGDRLLLAGLLRGVPPTAPVGTQMLLSHMRSYGVSVEQGRRFLADRPEYVRNVLAYSHYLQSEKGGYQGARRIDNWNAWVFRALEAGNYQLDDPGFVDWLERQAERVLLTGVTAGETPSIAAPKRVPGKGRTRRTAGARPATGAQPKAANGQWSGSVTAPDAPTASPIELPDDLWGRAVRAIQGEIEPQFLVRTYLASATLDRVEGDVVHVRAVDDFHAEKAVRTWGLALQERITAEIGRAVVLMIGRHRCEASDRTSAET